MEGMIEESIYDTYSISYYHTKLTCELDHNNPDSFGVMIDIFFTFGDFE